MVLSNANLAGRDGNYDTVGWLPECSSERSNSWGMEMTVMLRKGSLVVIALATLFAAVPARAQFTEEVQPRIPLGPERELGSQVTLGNNVRPEARPEYDRGPVAENFRMEHM